MKKLLIIITLIVLSYTIKAQNNTTNVIIIHINDIHAEIEGFDKLSAIIKSCKDTCENVFVISAGDMFSGNPLIDNYTEKGKPIIELMNELSFDAAVLGNHEFDYKQDILEKRRKEACFPILCANIDSRSSLLSDFPEYYFLSTNNGILIGLVGYLETSVEGKPATHHGKLGELDFYDALKVSEKYKSLKNKSDCFIALSHMGVQTDSVFAMQNPEYDVIIGGHSHTFIKNQKIVNNVLITQAGGNLKAVGIISLKFSDKKLVSKTSKLIDLKSYTKTDLQITNKINEYKKNNTLTEIIGEFTDSVAGKMALGNFFTDALRDYCKTDIAIQNDGGIRIGKINKGPVSLETIYRLDPFQNEMVTTTFTVAELKNLITFGYMRYKKPDIMVSGISYTITLDESGNIKETTIYDQNNKVLPDDYTLTTALNNYMAGSYKFQTPHNFEPKYTTSTQILIDYIKKYKTIKPNQDIRINIKNM